jgi:hypothetical protein
VLPQQNGVPDICRRCGGQVVATHWKSEGSCLQCGCWYYGNGNGHRQALLIPSQFSGELAQHPPVESQVVKSSDGSPFSSLARLLDRCASSNGGCAHCKARRRCLSLWNQASEIASTGEFGVHQLRVFAVKFEKIRGNHAETY